MKNILTIKVFFFCIMSVFGLDLHAQCPSDKLSCDSCIIIYYLIDTNSYKVSYDVSFEGDGYYIIGTQFKEETTKNVIMKIADISLMAIGYKKKEPLLDSIEFLRITYPITCWDKLVEQVRGETIKIYYYDPTIKSFFDDKKKLDTDESGVLLKYSVVKKYW